MLRTALLSRWHVHAMEYARFFQKNPESTVTCMWDEEPDLGRKFAKELGIEFEPDLDKLLSRPDVDAVCVNAPTNRHAGVIVKAALAGKHVFTEKVLALTSKECAEIREALEKGGAKFTISFPHRTFPHNLYAKKVLDDKLLGEVTYLRMRNAHNGASAKWLPAHFYDKNQCGGGAMIDLGAHPMYLIAWLLGKPVEIKSVFTSVTGCEVEDNAVSIMGYENGAIAVSETSFVSANSPSVLEIYGTEGSLSIVGRDIRLYSSKLGLKGYNGWITPSSLPDALPYPGQQFIDTCLHGKEALFGIDEAVLLTEMMEMAYGAYA